MNNGDAIRAILGNDMTNEQIQAVLDAVSQVAYANEMNLQQVQECPNFMNWDRPQ